MNKETVFILAKLILVSVLAVGLSRVFFLTVVMGSHFKNLAKGNMIRQESLDPIRGILSDKDGKPLAMNIENGGRTVRFYPGGETTAALVGYLGKPSMDDLKDCNGFCSSEMYLGKAGLEKQYQSLLIGKPGQVMVEETADGKQKSEQKRVESVPGENVVTNIDGELQKMSFLSLKNTLKEKGKSGAVVITKVSGEVLAMASAPSYDPNLFVAGGKRSDFGGDYKDVADLIKDTEKKPLFNRAMSGDFAPGSVYKLVPAIAALEEGKINRDTLIDDSGEIKLGEYRFGNWYLDSYGMTEGLINVEKALARSNDIFFYKIGEALGADLLVSWSKKFGLGAKTGVDLPGESDGFIPTPYWREKTLGERWFLGNTYHMAIGQGDVMTTPLQINRMTASVISGLICSPKVVGKGECVDLKLGEQDKQIVLEGMKMACSTGGTAFPLFDYEGKIYCKTGTAQKGGKDTEPNSWVSVVVPKGNSIKDWIVMTVLVEEGGEGSRVASPIAKEIMPYILK
jgi:penicillin-binding protein 2